MIESLRIRNLAVVEEAVVDFARGLNVLTGETGAGKSLILGALALLTGGRASSEVVRAGAKNASVEAVLNTAALPELERELIDRGIPVEDHTLVVSRSVSAEGRGRAEIGGQWVAVGALRELFDGRLEISSQHASQALRRREEHGIFLDEFGGLRDLSKKVREAYETLRAQREELRALREAAAERERQRDFLRFQCEEIDAAALAPGEIAELDEEQRRLAHADEIARGRHAAAAALSNDEPGLVGTVGALGQIERALTESETIAQVDPSLGPLIERLHAAREEIADLSLELVRGADRVEVDPARLGVVEGRIARIEALRRKYGASESEIAEHRNRLEDELRALSEDAGRAEQLEAESTAGARALEGLAKDLSKQRGRAGSALAREVERALASLEMVGARFEITFGPAVAPEGFPCGAHGAEEIEFLLGANTGEPARGLARVASGGELSRVFLALMRARLRGDKRGGRMMVFDEVDTGIGGSAIDRVGALLQELGEHHQVLCITHWPQIAGVATGHHRVRKTRRGSRTRTIVEALSDAGRVEELARMAGGAKVTAATRRHARELLQKRDKTASRTTRIGQKPQNRPPVSS